MADSMTLRDCTPRPHLVVIAVTVTADDCLGPDQFGRPSCFRVAASSRHLSPHAASRSLMWSSARFSRSANVLGLSSVDIQKLSHSFAATLDFLLVGRSFGCNAYLVALGPDRNAIGDRLFLCHDVHSFIGCVRIRTALPLTGRCLDELDSDFDPIRYGHTEPYRKFRALCIGGAITYDRSWKTRPVATSSAAG